MLMIIWNNTQKRGHLYWSSEAIPGNPHSFLVAHPFLRPLSLQLTWLLYDVAVNNKSNKHCVSARAYLCISLNIFCFIALHHHCKTYMCGNLLVVNHASHFPSTIRGKFFYILLSSTPFLSYLIANIYVFHSYDHS